MNDFVIYSIEDDQEISEVIKIALSKNDFVVKCFYDGESFLEEFNKNKPNLILLDLMLPGIQGDEILKKIRLDRNNNDIPIVILSAKSLMNDKINGLNDGADDYIIKPFNIKELVSRINVWYRKFLDRLYIIKLDQFSLHLDKEEFYVFNEKIDLTKNEYKIISTLFMNKGKVVSRDELFDKIWKDVDKDNSVSRTIDMHIKSLRNKIGDKDKEIIKSIYGNGYKIG